MNEQLFSGLTTGAAVGGNIISTLLANNANWHLARYSYNQQKKMIAEQNAYNSPIQQMARYQEAGLNPNLIYGNIDSGNQSGIAKYDAPTMQAPQVDGNILSGMQLMLAARENDAKVANLNAQTERYQEDTRAAMLRNNFESFLMGKPVDGWDLVGTRALQKYDLGLQSQSITNTMHQVSTDLNRMNIREKTFYLDKLLPLTWKLKQLEVQGVSYDNAMKAIDTTLWRDLRNSQINGTPFKLFQQVVPKLIPESSPTGKAIRDYLNETFTPFGTVKVPIKKLWNRIRKR